MISSPRAQKRRKPATPPGSPRGQLADAQRREERRGRSGETVDHRGRPALAVDLVDSNDLISHARREDLPMPRRACDVGVDQD